MSLEVIKWISFFLVLPFVYGLDPLVETSVGLIRGLKATDGDYSMFLGIPYAKVNLDNPFGPSIPYPAFNKTFEANNDSAKCPQVDRYTHTAIGTLDCLILNVHVPDCATSKNLLPVIVVIHGGGFKVGNGGRDDFGPKFLVKHDVIVVTFNYRIDVYGFMCLGTNKVPGNQGLKDQLLAFRWIKANIKAFGGDPNKITLMGQSAGGRSIDLHLMADNENLFSKAIFHSTTSLSPPGIGEVNTEVPVLIAKDLGFETEDYVQAVSFLKSLDTNSVVISARKLKIVSQPCVEKSLEGVEIFVPDFTVNRKVPRVRKIPLLMGFTVQERYYAHNRRDNAYYKSFNIFDNFLMSYFTFDDKQLAECEKLVRKFYVGDEELSVDLKQQLSDFDSDFTYIHPTYRRISDYIANGAEMIYQYLFSYDSDRNLTKKKQNITVDGAVHGDELGYLFDTKFLNQPPTPSDQRMIDRMTTIWTNFAKYGNPTPSPSELLPVKWEPVSEDNSYFYNIDSNVTLQRRPFNRRMTFLDLFFKMYGNYQLGYQENDSNV